jgi:hypothetical protein
LLLGSGFRITQRYITVSSSTICTKKHVFFSTNFWNHLQVTRSTPLTNLEHRVTKRQHWPGMGQAQICVRSIPHNGFRITQRYITVSSSTISTKKHVFFSDRWTADRKERFDLIMLHSFTVNYICRYNWVKEIKQRKYETTHNTNFWNHLQVTRSTTLTSLIFHTKYPKNYRTSLRSAQFV